jgi:hypothetical protein
MSVIQARFNQTVNEKKRYMWNYGADLSTGETVVSVANTVYPQGQTAATPPLVVSGIVIDSTGIYVVFYVQGGVSLGTYEIQFLATTSIGQIFEDIVAINIVSDL